MRERKASVPAPRQVINLMAALRQSIAEDKKAPAVRKGAAARERA